MPAPAWAHATAVGALVLMGLLALALDVDDDGLSTLRELRQGTLPWHGDTDGDGLGDGWELALGLNARAADADGDGLSDLHEVRGRSNPNVADSDGDGLADGDEPDQDCDADGLPAAADGDDDADERLDALEHPAQRCNADSDGDGVLDGHEQADVCIVLPDCDGDGLDDGLERDAGFNALDADTFKVGLPDSVSWAFAQAGQPAGRDADADGIPDPWEGTDGAITWGALRPQAGRRDLLLEYLRVEGPQSGRFDLDFKSAYQAVADAFLAQANVHVSWIETRLTQAREEVPPIVPSIDDAYYASVLQQGRHSANPFVTTVVLNPQHDQSEVAHAGIAPLRGMIAAVDYGQFAIFTFTDANGSSLSLTPLLEALVLDGQNNTLIEAGYDAAGVGPGPRIHLHKAATASSPGYTMGWDARWFNSPLAVQFDGGGNTTLGLERVRVNHAALASTILHELGHTLGLCHAHDAACSSLDARDQARHALSTMSYDSAPGTLRFLPSEWATAVAYLSCPPVQPVTLRAQQAATAEILQAKYVVDDTPDEARTCGTFLQRRAEFAANDPPPGAYHAPLAFLQPEGGSSRLALALVGSLGIVGMVVGLDVWLVRRWRAVAPATDAARRADVGATTAQARNDETVEAEGSDESDLRG